jgi:hypothetical protein
LPVSDKGGVSVYGLGASRSLCTTSSGLGSLDKAQDLREFLEANKEKLKLKE